MRKLLVALCGFCLSIGASAIEMPRILPPHKVTLLSGSVLRDDIDTQRSLHFQHGVEYSYTLFPELMVAGLFNLSFDRNFQARESYLDESLYGLHLIAYYSYVYLLRFSVGIGPSLRAVKSTLGIGNEIVYAVWQYGLGFTGSLKVDYAITSRWELGYNLLTEYRLPEPRTIWHQDIAHLFGVGYRF